MGSDETREGAVTAGTATGGVCALFWPNPGSKNISGETAPDAAIPPHPLPINKTTGSTARLLTSEPNLIRQL